jgi:hypothetical protein
MSITPVDDLVQSVTNDLNLEKERRRKARNKRKALKKKLEKSK